MIDKTQSNPATLATLRPTSQTPPAPQEKKAADKDAKATTGLQQWHKDTFERSPAGVTPVQLREFNFDDPKVIEWLAKDLGIDKAKLTKRSGDDKPFDGALVTKDGTIPMDKIGNRQLKDVPGFMPSGDKKPKETIIQVNGIMTTEAEQRGVLQDVADKTGAKVVGVHNATEGFLSDLKQCVGDKLNMGQNKAVDSLKSVVLRELNAGQDVHLMAHSQGGLITSRALGEVKAELEKQGKHKLLGKIKVETFGAAAGRYPDGPKYVHYINTKDPVPNFFGVDGKASFLANPGRDINGNKAVVREFTSGSVFHPIDAHNFKEVYLKERKSFDSVYHPDPDRQPSRPPRPVPHEQPPRYPFQQPSIPRNPRVPHQIPLVPPPRPFQPFYGPPHQIPMMPRRK